MENFINNSSNKKRNSLKKALKKIKYADKTKLNYYIIMGFIITALVFTTASFSAFVIENVINTTVVQIAKLSYDLKILKADLLDDFSEQKRELEIKLDDQKPGQIVVPKKSRISVDMELSTENTEKTRYSIIYSANNEVTVEYSHDYLKNSEGFIAGTGKINIRCILTNETEEDAQVDFEVKGGFINNELDRSNIVDGYYENDFVSRLHKIGLNNAALSPINDELPNTKSNNYEGVNGNYYYFRTVCTEEAKPRMVYEDEKWVLEIREINNKIACDTYYKYVPKDTKIEKYYELEDTFELVPNIKDYLKNDIVQGDEIIEDLDYYELDDITCSNLEKADFDINKNEIKDPVVEENESTICVAHFKHIIKDNK